MIINMAQWAIGVVFQNLVPVNDSNQIRSFLMTLFTFFGQLLSAGPMLGWLVRHYGPELGILKKI
jgi:hypothetical protein